MEEKPFDEWLNKYVKEGEEVLWKGKPNIKMPIMIFVVILLYFAFFAFVATMALKENIFWVNF